MIAKLTGILDHVGDNEIVVDVGGVGYLVSCSTATRANMPRVGEDVSLLIETHVRDDAIQLYGFLDRAEREWFRRLYSVQGVGAKLALAILSAHKPDTLLQAIAAGDKAALAEAEGVGPRLAARLIHELKDKIGPVPLGPPAGAAAASDEAGAAVSALVNLGYRRTEAFGAVSHAAQRLGREAQAADLIRAGLQELGR